MVIYDVDEDEDDDVDDYINENYEMMVLLQCFNWLVWTNLLACYHLLMVIYRVIFFTGTPPESSKYRKINQG